MYNCWKNFESKAIFFTRVATKTFRREQKSFAELTFQRRVMLGKVRYNKQDVSGNCQESYVLFSFQNPKVQKAHRFMIAFITLLSYI